MIDNGRITSPINTEDPYRLFGVGAYNGWWDIGYICSNKHGRINMWSRYKPVPLKEISVNDNYNPATKRWDEIPYADQGHNWGNNPWFFGSRNFKTYEVPTISELSDIGADGVQKDEAMWKYIPPYGGDYSMYRLEDFLGYNHYAKAPFNVNMSSEMKINSFFFAGIIENDVSTYDGEFSLSEMLRFAYVSNPVYAGIAIRNRTRNVLTGYVKKEVLGEEYGNGEFQLNPTSGALIENGGFSQTINNNDEVDVFLFLSYSPGDMDVSTTSKISAYLDKTCVCYKRYKVSYDYRIITVNYTFRNIDVNIYDNNTYYINDYDMDGEGSIYKITKYISAIYGNLTVYRTANSDYRNFNIISSGQGYGTRPDGGTFTTTCCPNVVYFSTANGNFNNADYRYTLNGSEDLSFIGYRSLDDAKYQRNGVRLSGIPIYDTVEYNGGTEYDDVGIISKRTVNIECDGFSSLDYTLITFKSTDTNNVIYKD